MDKFEDHVEAEELGVDASEEDIGVVHVQAITYRRSVVVLVEDEYGFVGTGFSSSWPGQTFDPIIARAHARRFALRNLERTRERVRLRSGGGVRVHRLAGVQVS